MNSVQAPISGTLRVKQVILTGRYLFLVVAVAAAVFLVAVLVPSISLYLLLATLACVVGLACFSARFAGLQKAEGDTPPASVITRPDSDAVKSEVLALQEQLDRMSDFASIGSHWYWETDADLVFTHVSGSFTTYTGIPSSQLTGQSLQGVLLFPRSQEQKQLSDRIASNKPFRDIHCTIALPDNERRFLSISGLPVYDTTGRLTGYRGTGRDVTEEIAAEDRASLARRRLADALNAMDSVLMLFDADETLIVANAKMRTIFAPVASQLHLGAKLPDVVAAIAQSGLIASETEDRQVWAREELERLRRGKGERLLRRIGDGWFQNRLHRTGEGGLLIIETDLTALIERDLKLQTQTKLLDSAFNSMAQGLAAFDADLNLTTCNRQFADMFGFPDEIVQPGASIDTMLRYLVDQDIIDFKDKSEDVLFAETRELYSNQTRGETIIQLKDGRSLEFLRQPVDGGGVVATYLDVTSRMETEEELHRAMEAAESANKAKTNFLANMSHELRTPLNSIIGFAEVIHDELYGKLEIENYKTFAMDIRDSGRHLLGIINDILELAKRETGQRDLVPERVELEQSVAAAVRLVRHKAEQSGLTIDNRIDASVPNIVSEDKLVRQMVINLLSNAIKFTPKDGHISVYSEKLADGGLQIVVEDTGIGMATKDIPVALEPFAQVDSDLSRKFEGTGLGLPLVNSIMKMHGGVLELESEPGTGTKAKLKFPGSAVVHEPAPEKTASTVKT